MRLRNPETIPLFDGPLIDPHQSAYRRSELDTGLCLLMDLLQTDTSQVGAAN